MHARPLLPLFLAALLCLPVVAAQGVPADLGCATNAVAAPLGEARYFCEPLDSTFFIQFDQFVAGLEHLDATYPQYIELEVIGESLGGLPVYFVEVTNEASPVPRDQKLQLGYSASIHANEAAGREGTLRMIEDLVAGIGPHGAELQPLLDTEILNVWFPNPDSWAAGDYFDADAIGGVHSPADGVGFARANLAGVDLNREFPNPGLISKEHTPMSEPESQAVVKELRFSGDHSNLVAGVDLHGMLNSQNMIRSIIPNQDYDFRRMVLAVDMLRTTEDRVNNDPAFAEWSTLSSLEDLVDDASGLDLGGSGDAGLEKPMQWGARWDMIGYTDTGFTSDYLMLSPRSPTGGMGAVGTITEFAYSHQVPDNHYVAKLTDMHVAGVRQIVRTQMEMVGRLNSPVLAGTGDVAYAWVEDWVSSDDDPGAYVAGQAFDVDDEATWFDFDQVPYRVNNLNFWRDLDDHSADRFVPVQATTFDTADLEGYQHFVISNQALDAMDDAQVAQVRDWVQAGGHLLLTDSALQWFDRAGLTSGAAAMSGTYLGYTDVQDWEDPLLADVTWGARVTGEGPAIGIKVGGPYPQWTLDTASLQALGADVVGTTNGQASLGHVPLGAGMVDFLGAALPRPVQVGDDGNDHRYGLADYSVSAFTYWLVMNSLGGHVEWQDISEPFVPYYPFDPLYGDPAPTVDDEAPAKGSPGFPVLVSIGLLAAVAAGLRRRG